jgi:hypothetical protein
MINANMMGIIEATKQIKISTETRSTVMSPGIKHSRMIQTRDTSCFVQIPFVKTAAVPHAKHEP